MSTPSRSPRSTDPDVDDEPRQRIEHVGRGRRVRLTPAPGTSEEPVPADEDAEQTASDPAAGGPNDERMRRDVPPHW
jgi:hypothetical protein